MGETDPAVHEALRWLRFSGEDITVALQLINWDTPAPRHACWLCQQAAEKALKAALVSEGVRFRHTHDLDALRNKLPEGWPIKDTHGDLAELTEWAIEARYPGDRPEPTRTDALKAESDARSVHDSITAEFKLRGMLI